MEKVICTEIYEAHLLVILSFFKLWYTESEGHELVIPSVAGFGTQNDPHNYERHNTSIPGT